MDDLPTSHKPDDTSDGRETSGPKHPHDEHGHFMHVDHTTPSHPPEHKPNPISQFLHDETAIHKTNNDELIDVHIGNPLRKIADLLEEIKKQKAFSFNIKGSLGVAGIVLVLGTFGIFGGTHALCDKGIQTKSGSVTILMYKETQKTTFIDKIPYINSLFPKPKINRVVLKEANGNIVHLTGKDGANVKAYNSLDVIATGDYDSCSNTLEVDTQTAIESIQ